MTAAAGRGGGGEKEGWLTQDAVEENLDAASFVAPFPPPRATPLGKALCKAERGQDATPPSSLSRVSDSNPNPLERTHSKPRECILKKNHENSFSKITTRMHSQEEEKTNAAGFPHRSNNLSTERERELFIDNLLVIIHFIIVMIRWTGLAPWEFESPFPGSLASSFLADFLDTATHSQHTVLSTLCHPLPLERVQDTQRAGRQH